MKGREVRRCDWQDASRGLLAFGEADVAIVDPPFSPRVHANTLKPLGFDPLTPAHRRTFCDALTVSVQRWAVIFTDIESVGAWWVDLAEAGMEPVRTGLWERHMAPQKSGDRPAVGAEAIVIAHALGPTGKPIRKRWNGGGRAALYRVPRVAKPRHPCEKPLALMEALVRDFTEPGELVADPFCGSGSTLVAAVKCGRRAIGWERNEGWARLARRRLRVAREQFDLFEVSA